jgi:hypothetical protein
LDGTEAVPPFESNPQFGIPNPKSLFLRVSVVDPIALALDGGLAV